jgi:5-methyltetrahydrofolate--homocysteine methyltransferase
VSVAGAEAKKVFDEAQVMLKKIISDKLLKCRGIVGFYPARSSGDDILVYEDEDSAAPKWTLYGLRQQAEVDSQEAYLSMSDFVAPVDSGKKDYIGMFAVSSGFGCDKLCKSYETASDDYNSIMASALADRLSEAFAECLHHRVRTELWGYSKDEDLSAEDLLRVKYHGIRPAPGYPTQPDHTEKRTMWQAMRVEEETGIALTESLAMTPAASVSGLYFAHEKSSYFSVGKLQRDQVLSASA